MTGPLLRPGASAGQATAGGELDRTVLPPSTGALSPGAAAGTARAASVSLGFGPITRRGTVTFTGTALAEPGPGIRRASEDRRQLVTARGHTFGW